MSGPLILSIFPGIDLLGMAFEQEWPEACVVRGPDLLWGGDIRRFHPPAGKFDGVIGGPPCQAFSRLAHLVRATGKEPRYGNLIPEFCRVVMEAAPDWYLMENVPAVPDPNVPTYPRHGFVLDNAWLGEEQMRRRTFHFGWRPELGPVPDLRRWIQLAALELPDQAAAVCRDPREVPVALLSGGKVKQRAVRGKNDGNPQPWEIANGRAHGYRRSWEESCRLQGLPDDFLKDAPFTKSGRMDALGNGVPLPMGRAIARAVKRATVSPTHPGDERTGG